MVVTICCGEALTPKSASLDASASRSRTSPAGSPYCSETAPSCAPLVTLRSAPASSGRSSQSAGSVPNPGIGRAPGGWNMPRINVVALTGNGCAGTRSAIGAWPGAARGVLSRTKKPRCLRASTSPSASSWS
jgi:hypothetical protein